jgi:hypothetical protein
MNWRKQKKKCSKKENILYKRETELIITQAKFSNDRQNVLIML